MVTGTFLRVKRSLTHKFLLVIVILLRILILVAKAESKSKSKGRPTNTRRPAAEYLVASFDTTTLKPLN